MFRQPLTNPPHWRKLPRDEYFKAEAYLREREKYCVAACARFLRVQENRGHVWYLPDGKDEISVLLLHSRRALFPVFQRKNCVPCPRFLSRFLGKVPIHAVQGLREDAELLESLMEKEGYFASDRNDYELMSLDGKPFASPNDLSKNRNCKSVPADLILRSPRLEDEEDLFALQAAYEQEEVLPKNTAFYPAASRLNLKNILSREYVLVAELGGRVVGKINTSAESFTRYQIGGVYVRPDCRGLGIGEKMAMVFTHNLLKQGRALTLFVKKRNIAARKIYQKAGFIFLADYRITYY
jgi:hypothetical protein